MTDAAEPTEFYRGLRKLRIAAEILSEALPFMQRYDQETVVIKYGGHAMVDAKLAEELRTAMLLHAGAGRA